MTKPENILTFLSGGGEMGLLTRQKDWSKTSVGNPDKWPQSLRTTLNILLNSKFPMFLWWGPDLICFYNDAYRPSLGKKGKHPSILGQSAREAWTEIWDTIEPLINQVLSGGEATWSEDQLIPIYRNGKIEDVYWTFSYSPVNDESGQPNGVLVTCYESTEKVMVLQEVKERETQLNFTIDAAELGIWDLDPVTNKFTANARLKEWFGVTPDNEIELSQAIDSIIEKDKERVKREIATALSPGSDGNYNTEYTIINPKTKEKRTVLAKGRALFNDDNVAYRFSGILQNITSQVSALKMAEESETRFRNIVKQAPLGISILLGSDFIVEMANETYLQIIDKTEEEFVNKPLFDSLPEAKQSVLGPLTQVLETKQPFHGIEFPVDLNRHGQKELTYFNFVYHPLKNDNGEVFAIMVVASDVTLSVNAKHSLSESEKQFRNLVMKSPIAMTIFRGKDFVIEMANDAILKKIWRKKRGDVIGKKILDVFPELKDQKYPDLLRKVYQSGDTHHENESLAYIQGDDGLNKFYLDFEYTPLKDTTDAVSGIMVTANDVTERVEARKKVEGAETRLRLATEVTELATFELDLATRDIIYSPRLMEIFGHPKSTVLSHQAMRDQVHPDDRKMIVEKAFSLALTTGNYEYVARMVRPSKEIRWIKTQGRIFFNNVSEPTKLIGTMRDITEEKNNQQELLESEKKFRLLADSMPQFIWTADPQGNLTYFNNSVYTYSGLTLRKLQSKGWIQIVHPDDQEENIKVWQNSIATGDDFIFEHRFRKHDGEYRWQLSRAIAQHDNEGNIQMWVGTSTDIQDQKVFTQELEKQVSERTKLLKESNIKLEDTVKELKKMNTELKSFAYVSSHDLQEPLRKIQTFSSRILEKEQANLSDIGKDYFDRMQAAAGRMQTLIEDLLAYSRTNTTARVFKKIPLLQTVNEVKKELRELIAETNASIEVGEMCEANVIPFQFRQLLNNLIGNSIKFSREGIPPEIRIESRIIKGKEKSILPKKTKNYCHLSIADNGIGFDQQYRDRIFEVFQRLHGKNDYDGTGIGLAIVKKIVENHEGIITAKGALGKGATFDIYIPEVKS